VFLSFILLTTASAQDKAREGRKVQTSRVVVRDGQGVSGGDDGDFVFDMMGGRGGFLGVSTMQLNGELRTHFGAPADSGVMISDVASGSPAEKAGLIVGDVITAVDGGKVSGPFGIARALRGRKAEENVRIDYIRSGERKQTSASLAEQKSSFKFEFDSDMQPLLALRGEKVANEQLDKTMKKLDLYFNSPEWKAKVARMSDCGAIQGRLQAMESRMHDLEKRLNDR